MVKKGNKNAFSLHVLSHWTEWIELAIYCIRYISRNFVKIKHFKPAKHYNGWHKEENYWAVHISVDRELLVVMDVESTRYIPTIMHTDYTLFCFAVFFVAVFTRILQDYFPGTGDITPLPDV